MPPAILQPFGHELLVGFNWQWRGSGVSLLIAEQASSYDIGLVVLPAVLPRVQVLCGTLKSINFTLCELVLCSVSGG